MTLAVESSPPRIGLFIIGDEILSGRRADQHFTKVVQLLGARGLQLGWAQYLPDDLDTITTALRRSFATDDVVFSCGGIGATPDDMTRQAAAAALDVPLALHPEAERLITERCARLAAEGQGTADMQHPENQQRLKMGEFPQGASVVDNPYNRIPGFHIQRHTFLPGFPVMAWPMIEAMLDGPYAQWHHAQSRVEHSFVVYGMPESRITPALEAVERDWPSVRVFSLPSSGSGKQSCVELGVKGPPDAATAALTFLRAEAQRLGGAFSV